VPPVQQKTRQKYKGLIRAKLKELRGVLDSLDLYDGKHPNKQLLMTFPNGGAAGLSLVRAWCTDRLTDFVNVN
jgi:hypothetical protein